MQDHPLHVSMLTRDTLREIACSASASVSVWGTKTVGWYYGTGHASTQLPLCEVQRHRASHDNNDGRAVSPGRDAALYVAGSPHEHETDEPGQPESSLRDAGEYDERGEASHKGDVKIA